MKATKTTTCTLLALTLTMLATGCAQVPAKGGLDNVQAMVSDRTGQRVYWRQGTEEDKQVDETINSMLEHELSAEQAVAIALLNNRGLQATLEELGITQADVVQVGLLKNPTLGVLARWPSRSVGTGANIEFDLVFDFLDLALLPIRKRMAELQFDQVRLEVAHDALALIGKTKDAYYHLQAAGQIYQMRMVTFEASDASYELARRMHEAGNISLLELEREQGMLEQSRIEAGKAELEVAQNRVELAQLLGLYGKALAFKIQPGLPKLPDEEPPADQLESLAMKQRLDLAAAVRQTQTLAKSAGLTKDYRFLLISDIGVQTEREFDGTWLTGPQLTLELPIFDQKQASIAKAQAQLRQSEHRLWAKAVEIRSEVRQARLRMLAARKLALHYRDVVIPLRENIVKHTTEEYSYMLVGVFEAISAREKEYEAYQEYIQSVRDYWIAKTNLNTAVGGSINANTAAESDSSNADDAIQLPVSGNSTKMNHDMPMDMDMKKPAPYDNSHHNH